jgi:hypothetical protein
MKLLLKFYSLIREVNRYSCFKDTPETHGEITLGQKCRKGLFFNDTIAAIILPWE